MSDCRIAPLAFPAPEGCEGLTYPAYRPYVRGIHPQVAGRLLMTSQGPRGLGLGWIGPDGTTAQIGSLFVAPEYRNAGWGGKLLAGLEGDLRARQANLAWMIYTDSPSLPPLEAILRGQGWAEPRRRMILCKTEVAHMVQSPWAREASLAEGFSLFSWAELTAAERALILKQEGTPGWHPAGLSPFTDEPTTHLDTSLGLRYRGEVAGWSIQHRVIPGAIHYSTLFVRADLRRKAPHLPMLAAALRLHQAHPVFAEAPFAIFIQPADDPVVHRFFVRRLKDHIVSAKTTWSSCKRL